MELRAPIPEPDSSGEPSPWARPAAEDAGPDVEIVVPDTAAPDVKSTEANWRVDRRLTVAKIIGAVVLAAAAAIGYPDPGRVLVVGLAAAMLAVLAARDLLVPVRLAADAAGVTVATGFVGHRRLAWDQIDGVRVDARRGLMLRSQVLELDAGDNLYFFSVNELGAPCDEVADRLLALRP